jgi:hypothetical protein
MAVSAAIITDPEMTAAACCTLARVLPAHWLLQKQSALFAAWVECIKRTESQISRRTGKQVDHSCIDMCMAQQFLDDKNVDTLLE